MRSKEGKTDIHSIMPVLPLSIRLQNWLGAVLERLGAFQKLLSVESIIKKAEKKTGLSDWGDKSFLTPLELLTQPGTDDIKITFFGKLTLREELVRCLMNRLLIQDEIKRHPETLSEKISRPLFIVGLPRTGSTLLQRLLSQDPHCRPLLHWESVYPAPAPDPRTYKSDPRIKKAKKDLEYYDNNFPEYASMHFMDAMEPDECWHLLQNTFMVPDPFISIAEFPRYFAWQQDQDMGEAYRFYKLQLQILQRNFPPAHWVLKASAHLRNLDTLISTFPDACIIHLHRDPQKVIASSTNMIIKMYGLTNILDNNAVSKIPQQIIEDSLYDIERAIAAREQADPLHFLDVYYDDLIKDPIDVIRKIYDYFGYIFTNEFRDRTEKWMDENPKEKHGPHRYSLEQFGMEANKVNQQFSAYNEYFQVKPKTTA